MNSLYRYLIKITGFLGLWIMIFPGLGLDCDSASAKSAANVNSEQTADGGGKIIMLNIMTESPNKRIPLPGKIPAQQPPSAKKQLEHSGSKRVKKQPVAKHQSSDVTVPINAPRLPDPEPIIETPEIQETVILEPQMPAAAIPLLTETHPQPLNDKNVPPVSKINDDTQTASKKPIPEYAPQQDFIHDNVGIIARLLLKFSLITV
ncbi:MAG: hypothetical protein Q7U40_12905, partial [Desulfatirhabdiaceae bacterium]|nr:hypothetical protein [Desulfatirhabdiaceae bacterium]